MRQKVPRSCGKAKGLALAAAELFPVLGYPGRMRASVGATFKTQHRYRLGESL